MSNPDFRRQLRDTVLGPPTFTIDELMSETGTPREFADELWLSLGFPLSVGDEDEVLYSEPDADALRSLNALVALDLVERETLMAMTRVMGQTMARLAAAQVQMFDEELRSIVSDDEAVDDEMRAAVTELLVPGVERFVAYCFRRHLLAALDRVLDAAPDQPVIGFVDIVNFTRTTRRLEGEALADIVSRFDRHVYETVTNSGARLRKSLGDGVMFDAPDAETAARAALALVLRCSEDPMLGGARGGLAMGPTLEKEGDIYGETVNRASRLAALAFPNTVLADQQLGEDLVGVPGFETKPLGRRWIRGLGRVDVAVIRPSMA